MQETNQRAEMMLKAYEKARTPSPEILSDILTLRTRLLELQNQTTGSPAKSEVSENEDFPLLMKYLSTANMGTMYSTYGPTPTHKKSLENARTLYNRARTELEDIRKNVLPSLEKKLRDIGAPWLEGQELPVK
jgi:hypothetical protein